MNAEQPKSVDEYIARFPPDVQSILKQIRATIKKAAPKAEEVIRYNMPGYFLNGKLVDFAAFKNHIGFYPRASAIEQFKKELAAYKSDKGTVQFPLDEPIPYKLIQKMVEFRVKENLEGSATD
jgi:uncharacterized protein YdhG (YjbR/CyaY superfamily)